MDTHYKKNKFKRRYLDSKKCLWLRQQNLKRRNREREKNSAKCSDVNNHIFIHESHCYECKSNVCNCNIYIKNNYYDCRKYHIHDDFYNCDSRNGMHNHILAMIFFAKK